MSETENLYKESQNNKPNERRIENMKLATASSPESIKLITGNKSASSFNDESALLSNKV